MSDVLANGVIIMGNASTLPSPTYIIQMDSTGLHCLQAHHNNIYKSRPHWTGLHYTLTQGWTPLDCQLYSTQNWTPLDCQPYIDIKLSSTGLSALFNTKLDSTGLSTIYWQYCQMEQSRWCHALLVFWSILRPWRLTQQISWGWSSSFDK